MSIGFVSILLMLALIVLLASGIRIAFGLGFLAMIGILFFLDMTNLYQVAEVAEETCSNLFLVTLPLVRDPVAGVEPEAAYLAGR